jgi:hypothetical protein
LNRRGSEIAEVKRVGLFGKKRKAKREEDKVWLTAQARLNGICAMLREARQEKVLIIAHFAESLEQMVAALEAHSLPFAQATETMDRSLISDWVAGVGAGLRPAPTRGEALLTLSEMLPDPSYLPADAPGSKVQARIIGVERHPLRARDAQIEMFADALPHTSALEFHIALDEPLMRLFGGDRIMPMINMMGMADSKVPLQAATLSKSIEAAQEKIEKRISGDVRTDSAEEWFRVNGLLA